MKLHFLSIFLIASANFLCQGWAQQLTEPWQRWAKKPIESPVVLKTVVNANAGTPVYFQIGGVTYTNTGTGAGTYSTNSFVAQLNPHHQYPLSITGGNWQEASVELEPYVSRHLLSKRSIEALAKPDKTFVGNYETNYYAVGFPSLGNNATNCVIEVRPDRGFRPPALEGAEDFWGRDEDSVASLAIGDGVGLEIGPGRSTNVWAGAFRWAVNLGHLWNGSPCGLVRLNEKAIGSKLFTAAPLSYTARSTNISELQVITLTNGELRQIKAPQGLLDIQATNSPNEQCILRFYPLASVGASTNVITGLFPINTENPFVVWRIKNPNSQGTSNTVSFVEERAGTTNLSEIQFSNSVWTLRTGTGAELRSEIRTVAINGPARTETVQITSPTNAVYQATEHYHNFAWGWELTNVISDPNGAALTHAYSYYTNAQESLTYRKLKEHWSPGGRWERFYYAASGECPGWPFGDPADYFGVAGVYSEIVLRPWKDGPANPDNATLSNVVQAITTWTGINIGIHDSLYLDEFLGDWNNSASTIYLSTGINGSGQDGGLVRDYRPGRDGSSQNEYRYSIPGHYLHDRVRRISRSDERGDYCEYTKGTFSWNGQSFASDEASGKDFKVKITHGSGGNGFLAGLYPHADLYTDCGGGFSVHAGKSTQEELVYQGGNLVFKQLSACKEIDDQTQAPVILPVSKWVMSYDSLGHLTNQTWIDVVNTNISRVVYEAGWAGDLKLWEVDEVGIKLTNSYDSLKQLKSITRIGVNQPDIVTNFVYDSAGRLTGLNVSAAGLGASRKIGYDLAGRVTSISGLEGATTNISYSADTRIVTETGPGGITVIKSYYLDGRLKSITGTGVVSEYVDYSITTNQLPDDPPFGGLPKNVTRTDYGSIGSGRWRERVTGVDNVLVQNRFPRFSTNTQDPPLEETFESWAELITAKTSPALYANDEVVSLRAEYTHNGYGSVIASGTPVDDRRTGQDDYYEHDGTSWFLVSQQTQYTGSGDVTNQVRQKLSGYSSTQVLSEATLVDIDSNSTVAITYLDRAAKKVTAVTNSPRSTLDSTNVTINGLAQYASRESVSNPAWFYYDALGRVTSTKDSLGFWRSISYDPVTGWVTSTTDPTGQATGFEYCATNEANAGRVKCRIAPGNKRTRYDYTTRGELYRTWGDVPYPEERIYNSFGEFTELHTFQGGTAWASSTTWPGASVSYQSTIWNYDAPTGLLVSKIDASGRGYTNNYWPTYILKTRTWARGVTVTNTFNIQGELMGLSYSDGTPSVTISDRNRFGRPTAITDALGTLGIEYDFAGRQIGASWGWDSPLDGLSFSNYYHQVYGPNRISFGVTGGQAALVHEYGFDSATGRLNLVSNGNYTASYVYLPSSDFLRTTSFRNNGTDVLTATRSWEYGSRLGAIVNQVNGVTVTSHGYRYDALNRRTQAVLEDGSVWGYCYNDRNELIGAGRSWPDWSPASGQQFGYGFDNIGNRKSASTGGDVNGQNLRTTSYSVNNLNQYTNVATPGYEDIIGLAFATNTVTVNSGSADRKGEYFHREITIANTSGPLWQNVAVTSGSATTNGGLVFPDDSQRLTFDLDGNLASDGTWTYDWDAENRLRSMVMTTNVVNIPSTNRFKLEFAYDYQGRRVQKIVSTNSTGNTFVPQSTNRFVYDGWNLVATLNPQSAIVQSFLWGQDLSGTMDGAGGIGGLVAVGEYSGGQLTDANFCSYDGNGNITALTKASNSQTTARYEYSPYGELLRLTGPMARVNPFRFSTKFWDEESGLVYYGYRYFHPGFGRWMSRDPIEERGGNNLLAYCMNSPMNIHDALGTDGTLEEEEVAAEGAATVGAEGAASGMRILNRVRTIAGANNAMAGVFNALIRAAAVSGEELEMVEAFLIQQRAVISGIAVGQRVTTVLGRYSTDMNQFFNSATGQFNVWGMMWQRLGHNLLSMPQNWSRSQQLLANFRWLAEAVARGDKIYLGSAPGAEIGTATYSLELLFLRALGYSRAGDWMVR